MDESMRPTQALPSKAAKTIKKDEERMLVVVQVRS